MPTFQDFMSGYNNAMNAYNQYGSADSNSNFGPNVKPTTDTVGNQEGKSNITPGGFRFTVPQTDMPESVVQTFPVSPQNEITTRTLPPFENQGLNAPQLQTGTGPTQIPPGGIEQQPVAPVAPQQLNAPHLQTGTGPTQIPPGGIQQQPPVATAESQQLNAPKLQTGAGPTQIPAGGIEQQPAQPGSFQQYPELQEFAANQNNPEWLAANAYNKNPVIGRLVQNQLFDNLKKESEQRKTQAELTQAAESGDPRYFGALMRNKEKGHLGLAMFFDAFGFREAAKDQYNKLGFNDKWATSTLDNQTVAVKYAPDGTPREGRFISGDFAGQDLNKSQLARMAGGLMGIGKPTGASIQFEDESGKTRTGYYVDAPNGRRLVDSATHQLVTYEPKNPRHIGQVTPVDKARISIAQSHVKAMQAANNKAKAAGAQSMPFSQDEIDAENASILNGNAPSARSQEAFRANPEPVAPAPVNASTGPAGATAEGRAAADINNPSGLGWDGKNWTSYKTPRDGVIGTENLVSKKLGTQGLNTPETLVGNWVTGDASKGATVQGGAYVKGVRDELQSAGVKLNSDGTIPNTPEAVAAVTRGIIKHETAANRQADFLKEVTGRGGQAQTGQAAPAGPWATPEANRVAKANPNAEAIANYKKAPPSSTSGGQASVMADVLKINPDYDQGKFKAAQTTRNDFATTKPNTGGGQLQAVNRAIPHLDQYEQAVRDLNNNQMPLVNKYLQQFQINVGDDKVAAARAIQGLVSDEVGKAVRGGLGGVEERKDLRDQMATTLNPQQLASVIKAYQGLMIEQATGLKRTWTSNGLPAREFDEKLVPRAQEIMIQHEKDKRYQEYLRTRKGGQ